MPTGITFKPKDTSHTHLWLAEVESDIDKDIQNEEQTTDQTIDMDMDVNKIHDILQEPSDFHTPNIAHNTYIPANNQQLYDTTKNI